MKKDEIFELINDKLDELKEQLEKDTKEELEQVIEDKIGRLEQTINNIEKYANWKCDKFKADEHHDLIQKQIGLYELLNEVRDLWNNN